MAARNQSTISFIVGKIGELMEIDRNSLEGFRRSVRVKINIDLQRPLKKGITLELGESHKILIEFKYERLHSFYYVCGNLGHMRKEFDLAERVEGLENLPETKLPFGDWMRAFPLKKAAVRIKDNTTPKEHTSVRKCLFEKFKQSMERESKATVPSQVEEEIRLQMGSVAVRKKLEEKLRGKKSPQGTDQEMETGNPIDFCSSNRTPSKTYENPSPPFIDKNRANHSLTIINDPLNHNKLLPSGTPPLFTPHKLPTPTVDIDLRN
ncbi:hypothetical protein ACS0TY_020581 [Phlomoides rotata]